MSSEHDGKDQDDLFSPLPYLLVSGAVVLMTLLLRCLFCRASSSDRPDRDDSATAAEEVDHQAIHRRGALFRQPVAAAG